MRLRLIFLLLVATVSGTVAGLADNARAGKPRTALPAPAPLPIDTQPYACPVPNDLRDEFRAAASDTDLPLAMIVAVAKVESNLDREARSAAGAHGLLQVLPATAAQFELDAYHVGENVLAGARYLRELLDRFESTELALAAYNAGPTAVEKAGRAPSIGTLRYAKNVLARARTFAGCR